MLNNYGDCDNFVQGLTCRGIAGRGFASGEFAILNLTLGEVTYVWLLSSTDPQASNVRGLWTNDGIWGDDDELWFA